ncbi:MAG: hypothetical protein H6560_11770 [Lewinellaceae bacterium]|nr:hypothetical protein [Lewinellaceae bacterium]
MKSLFLFILTLLFLASCRKHREALPYNIEALNKCIRSSVESNPEEPSDEHVEFKLNSNRILINDGEVGYEQFNDVAQTFITSGPILNPAEDTSRHYLLRIGFDQPQEYFQPTADHFYIALQKKESLNIVEFIDKYIKVGELKLNRKPRWDTTLDPELEDGFAINYWCAHCCEAGEQAPAEGGYAFAFSSTNPEQDGFLTCTKLERVDLGEAIWYQIEFEFACKLFGGGVKTDSGIMESIVVGQIEEGKMVVDFVVKK